jgi:hypothetical protein
MAGCAGRGMAIVNPPQDRLNRALRIFLKIGPLLERRRMVEFEVEVEIRFVDEP